EEQEERNEFWVTVRERAPVRSPVRLVLRPFTPVSGGAGDEDLAVGQAANAGGGRCAGRRTGRRASFGQDPPLGGPVSAHPFRGAPGALIRGYSRRPRKVSNPQGDRALRDTQPRHDLLVVQALQAQVPGHGAQVILGVGPTGPLARRFSQQSFLESPVADRAKDLLDLTDG